MMASAPSNQIPLMTSSTGRSPDGCAFHKRCPYATERCAKEVPALRQVSTRQVACHYAEQFL
ncbi:oligopeptide/dipeptide ABC transporter ATP-binding protein [Pseudomonas monteilii]|uniref:oligopeptide/dipeptide ABC transporter ATP-binding protein n=1 Tax=Pseudomonas monteilii TaxID=76759 RepID=UPI002FBEF021